MLNIVIFGAPGSGKGTQSELIIKEYGLDHISTGDVLRSEMKNETELGKIAKDYIEKGQLVPDELIVDMLAKVLDSKVNSKGVIFDGFPRTIPQAKALKEDVERAWNRRFRYVEPSGRRRRTDQPPVGTW